ncbi:MAG: preprotein translocase subunit SecE [Candidatus Andersenbacteria bacterium]
MGLRDRLEELRKGPGATSNGAAAPKEKRERVGPLRYLREVRDELVKVSWPKRRQVVRGTVQVLVVSLIFVVVLGGLDLAFQLGLKELLKKDLPATPPTATTTSAPATDSTPAATAQ